MYALIRRCRIGFVGMTVFLLPSSADAACGEACPGVWSELTAPAPGAITSIAYAPDGRLFVGLAANGLRVYEPSASGLYSWRSITQAAGGLGSNSVNCLAIFHRELWVGTEGAGISILDLDDDTWGSATVANSALPSDLVRRITAVVPADGPSAPRSEWEAWASTAAGAARYYTIVNPGPPPREMRLWQVIDQADGLIDPVVRDVAVQDISGTRYAWIATTGSLMRWDGDSLSDYTLSGGFHTASRMIVDGLNNLWCDGLQEVPVKGSDYVQLGVFRRYRVLTWRWELIDDIYGGDMSADPKGRVWFGNAGNSAVSSGAWMYDRGAMCVLKTPDVPLYSNNVKAVLGLGEMTYFGHQSSTRLTTYTPNWESYTAADVEGSGQQTATFVTPGMLFVGLGGGISWSDTDGATWSHDSLGGNTAVIQTLFPADGTLWVGTKTRGIYTLQLATRALSSHRAADGLASDDVRAIVRDRQDRIWAATSGGLALRANGYWLNLTTATSQLPSNDLRALTLDKLGRLWIGTYGAGIAIFDPEGLDDTAWSFMTTANGLPSNMVNGLARVGDSMWAATDAGVGHYATGLGLWVPHTAASGALPNDKATCVAGDRGFGRNVGRVWVGTEGGVALWENLTWTHYHPTNSKLGGDRILSLDADWGRLIVAAGNRLALRKNPPRRLGDFPPEIDSFTPAFGAPETTVTLNGNNFDARGPEFNSVFIGTAEAGSGSNEAPAAEIVSATTTQIVFKVPHLARSGKVRVLAHCMDDESAAVFEVRPRIDDVAPLRLGRGEYLVITGCGFSADGGVEFRVGNGAWRRPMVDSAWDTQKPDELRVRIEEGDTSGTVRIRTSRGYVTTSSDSVTITEVTVANVRIQQAIEGISLVWGKRTLVELSLQASGSGAHVEQGRLYWKLIDGTRRLGSIAYTAAPSGTAVPIDQGDPISQGVAFVAEFHSNRSGASAMFPLLLFNGVRIELRNRDVLVTALDLPASQFGFFDVGETLKFRCMAVWKDGGSLSWHDFWQRGIAAMLETARLFPQQDVIPYNHWLSYTPVHIVRSSVEIGENEDDALDAVDSHLDPAYDTIGVALVHPELYVQGSPPGVTPWSTCDTFGGGSLMSFNLDGTAGKTMAHEGGHACALVDSGATNYDDGNYNAGHSMYDDGMEHHEDGPGVAQPCDEHQNLTLYQAVVDQLGFHARIFRLDAGPPVRYSATACSTTNHGNSLMSYAGGRADGNCFFEPLDYTFLLSWFYYFYLHDVKKEEKGPGDRLHLRGNLLDAGGLRVTLSYVEAEGSGESPPDPRGAYKLIMSGAGGAALLEHPFRIATRSSEGPIRNPRFGLIVPFPAGTAKAEIRQDNVVRWSANVSAQAPKVTLTSPAGGNFRATDVVSVAWTASDADSRDLQFGLEYTPDGGDSWYPITQYLTRSPYAWTPGFVPASLTGQLRIRASDGFNTAFASSPTFRLGGAPPYVFIDQPKSGATFMEGQRVDLVAHSMSSSGPDGGTFSWVVDGVTLDGAGQTAEFTFSRVGVRTIEVRVRDAAQTGTASTSITIVPDYDRDGIPNDYELARKFNPVDRRDAAADTDEDGLTNLSEFMLGTNPLDDDSDNDGVLDGEEVVRGYDPTSLESVPPVAPVLQVGAGSLGFVVEAGAASSDARTFWVTNSGGGQLAWTVQSKPAWLAVDPAGGAAPSEVAVTAVPGALGVGSYAGTVVFRSAGAVGSPKTIPVRLQVIESLGVKGFIRGDSNMDKTVNIADAINTLQFLFAHGTPPPCRDAADTNDDGKIDIADAIYTLGVLFAHATPPKAPYPGCGVDPTNDALTCDRPADCK